MDIIKNYKEINASKLDSDKVKEIYILDKNKMDHYNTIKVGDVFDSSSKNWAFRLPICILAGLVSSIIYFIYLIIQPADGKIFANFSTADADAKEITRRSMARGTLVSVFSAFLLNILTWVLTARSKNINETKNACAQYIGFIFGPVLGFMLDIGFGSEEGYQKLIHDPKWIFYFFGSLCTSKFCRYIITFLLDMFISDTIMRNMLKLLGGSSGLELALKSRNNTGKIVEDHLDIKTELKNKVIQLEHAYLKDETSNNKQQLENYEIVEVLDPGQRIEQKFIFKEELENGTRLYAATDGDDDGDIIKKSIIKNMKIRVMNTNTSDPYDFVDIDNHTILNENVPGAGNSFISNSVADGLVSLVQSVQVILKNNKYSLGIYSTENSIFLYDGTFHLFLTHSSNKQTLI